VFQVIPGLQVIEMFGKLKSPGPVRVQGVLELVPRCLIRQDGKALAPEEAEVPTYFQAYASTLASQVENPVLLDHFAHNSL